MYLTIGGFLILTTILAINRQFLLKKLQQQNEVSLDLATSDQLIDEIKKRPNKIIIISIEKKIGDFSNAKINDIQINSININHQEIVEYIKICYQTIKEKNDC